MYKILLFFKWLKENKEEKVISVSGVTFSLTRRSQDIRNKNVIRKMDGVSDYEASGKVLIEYVKTE